MKCAVSQKPSRQTRILNYLQSKTKHPTFRVSRLTFSVPSQGRSVTQARRLYESRLANFRVSDPRYGVANKDVSYRHCAKDGAFGGHPAPSLRTYTVSLVCVVSTERGVTQVPFWPLPPTSRQPLSLPRAQSRLALHLKS